MDRGVESEGVIQAKERIIAYTAVSASQLDLSGLELTAQELRSLMPSIHRLSNLKQLDISDIALTMEAFNQMNLSQIWGTVKASISFDQNEQYIGDIRWGNMTGYGVRTFANGDLYEGGFRQGAFHGHGILKRANGNAYEGEFKNGVYDGQGVFSRKDGTSYEGEFKEGAINGYGSMKYPNGDIQRGNFENGYMIFESPGEQKKPNKVVTLLARSKRMDAERRIAKYERDKHQEGGAPVKVVVVDEAKELFKEINALLEEHKGINSFKLAFNQHSGNGTKPDIKLDHKDARAILQLLVDKGIEDIRISSHSCDLCEVKEFMAAAPKFTENAQISILTVPDGKYAYEGWKKNPEGEKKFTSFYINNEGEYLPRDKHVFEKQQKHEAISQSATADLPKEAFTTPLNREKAKPAVTSPGKSATKLKERKKVIHSRRK